MDRSLVKNAADKDQVRRATVAERDRIEVERHDLLAILETQGGRRFLFKWITAMGVFESRFYAKDHSYTCYKLGQQSVGMYLAEDIKKVSTPLYLKMITENL